MSNLHWPVDGVDLGVGGVSCVELLCELWAGERLSLEKSLSLVSLSRAPNFSVGCSFWSKH